MYLDFSQIPHWFSVLALWAVEHVDQITIAIVSILSYLHLLNPIKDKLVHSNFEQIVRMAYSAAAWASRTGKIQGADKVAHALKMVDEYTLLFQKRAATPVDLDKAKAIFTHLHEQEDPASVPLQPVLLSTTFTPAVPQVTPTGHD